MIDNKKPWDRAAEFIVRLLSLTEESGPPIAEFIKNACENHAAEEVTKLHGKIEKLLEQARVAAGPIDQELEKQRDAADNWWAVCNILEVNLDEARDHIDQIEHNNEALLKERTEINGIVERIQGELAQAYARMAQVKTALANLLQECDYSRIFGLPFQSGWTQYQNALAVASGDTGGSNPQRVNDPASVFIFPKDAMEWAAKQADNRIKVLGENIHPAAKRVLEELAITIRSGVTFNVVEHHEPVSS